VYFQNENTGWVAGTMDYYGDRNVAIAKTMDGGNSWVSLLKVQEGQIYTL